MRCLTSLVLIVETHLKMTEKQIKRLMKKYLEGKLTKSEEMLLEGFDSTLLKENLEQRQKLRSDDNLPDPPVRFSNLGLKPTNRLPWLSVAAAIILLIGMGAVFYNTWWQQPASLEIAQIVKTAERGKRLTLQLSDGTRVYLNSGSSIEFPQRFVGQTREVRLEGEAFFEVAKDPTSPFIIHSNDIQTTVLGTSFNVNSYQENAQIKISVKSGKVKVDSKEHGVILGAHQQAVFDKKTKNIQKQAISSDGLFAWKDGVIEFRDQQMDQVITTLERWYGVEFILENQLIKNCHLTATYKNEPLGAVLESIIYTKKGLRYLYVNEHEILLSGSCTD